MHDTSNKSKLTLPLWRNTTNGGQADRQARQEHDYKIHLDRTSEMEGMSLTLVENGVHEKSWYGHVVHMHWSIVAEIPLVKLIRNTVSSLA